MYLLECGCLPQRKCGLKKRTLCQVNREILIQKKNWWHQLKLAAGSFGVKEGAAFHYP